MTFVMLCLLVLPLIAWAQATSASPFDPALLFTYLWVVGISAMGGLASFYRKVKSGHTRWANLAELVGELVISASAGLITYWLTRWAGVNDWAAAAMVGISGHMGSRAFFLFEKVFEQWVERVFGATTKKEG